MEGVKITHTVLQRMIQHALKQMPQEGCGLLAGKNGLITQMHPLANQKQSETEYFIDPRDLFDCFRRMREAAEEFYGIYHSHPRAEAFPSKLDIEQAFYPCSVYFIVSCQDPSEPLIRAFMIAEGKVTELEIMAAGDSPGF